MLIGLPDFSCLKIFIFQCFKSVISFVDTPTTAAHLQTPTLESSSAQPTVASCTGADKGRAVFSQPEIGQSNILKCFNIYGCKTHNLKVGSLPIDLLPILLIQAKRVYCEVCNNAIQSQRNVVNFQACWKQKALGLKNFLRIPKWKKT